MTLLGKLVRKIGQKKTVSERWMRDLIASVGTVGLSLSVLLMSASAAEADSHDPLNDRSQRNLTRLQVLQLGARRAQLDRVLRSQTAPAPISELALQPVLELDREVVSAHSFSTHFSTHSFPTGDGTYLYGQYPAYDQPATAYFVFERKAELIEGAFYMPSSSFDCARGRVDSDGLQLTITNSYSQESYSYALDTELATTQTASGQNIALPQRIRGYYALPVRAYDRAILANCQVQ